MLISCTAPRCPFPRTAFSPALWVSRNWFQQARTSPRRPHPKPVCHKLRLTVPVPDPPALFMLPAAGVPSPRCLSRTRLPLPALYGHQSAAISVRSIAVTLTHLGERQLLRVGAALADALLDDAHGESPVSNAGCGVAGVAIVGRDVRVHAVQQQLKALGGIAQTAQGKASAGQGAAGQGATQWLRTQCRL